MPPLIFYSDAEWTILNEPPWLSKGLGGIMWDDTSCRAAALDTPRELVNALSDRKTQIIPLELMAAAGVLFTYKELLRGRDVLFFIDNQSVCGALAKGTSKSRDIQHLATAWHILTLHLRCRVWIEWVPSESNPADMLSRDGTAPFEPTSEKIDDLQIPEWAAQGEFNTILNFFETLKSPVKA